MKTILRMALVLSLFTGSARAFSLLGPYDTWMQPTNGFRLPGDIGGPMNLNQEYRWNVPVLVYAFDESFVNYFGSNGVWAVEQAIKVLNDLPDAAQLDPAAFPAETTSYNFKAQALNLTDLKSKTLATLLQQLGLTQPTRFTFNERNFGVSGGIQYGPTVMHNFDPFTLAATNWVNDTAYNYVLQVSTNGTSISVIAAEYAIDPLANIATAVADDAAGAGGFYPGLTRDDVGGLRYLLDTNNANFEILLSDVHGFGANAGNYTNQAMRLGANKLTFIRKNYDPLMEQLIFPYVYQFTDYYLSNYMHPDEAVIAQQLERTVTVPDILFCAGNYETDTVTNALVTCTGTTNWWNSTLPSNAAGPGLIRPPIKLTYSKPTTTFTTWDATPNNADGYSNYWGTFDGSTNDPVVYPLGTAANDLTLNLHLMRDTNEIGRASWQLPLATGDYAYVHTSTNLVQWSFHAIFRAGQSIEWYHYCSDAQRFFRLVPNN